MLLLASATAEAVPASVKNKLLAHHHQDTGYNSQSFDSIKPCKYLDDNVVLKRMKQRSFTRTNSNINEPSKVKKSKKLHERQVRSIEYTNTLAGYDFTAKTRRNISLDSSFRESVVNNGKSLSLENISHATLATSDVKSDVQKDSSDRVYLHVNGSLKLVFVLLTVLGILIPIASIIYCFWTTRRSATSLEQVQRRLADNENNLLNQSLPDLEALMLSVQNLGCYRLGMPENTMGAPLSSQRDDRSIRRSTFPIQHDLIISANRQTQNLLDESKTELKSGIKSEDKRRNIYTSCSSNSNCPPHIHRSDGEFGRDRFSSSSSQHNAEVKRCYIQAPPNKCVLDVPDIQDTRPFHFSVVPSYASSNHNSQQQLAQSKGDNKVKTMVKGFFMKINGSGTQKAENSKINSNIASMPRSQSSNVSTDTSNELVLNGSTNFNLHSKSYVNNNDSTASSTGATARLLKPSGSPSSSSSGSSPEQSL